MVISYRQSVMVDGIKAGSLGEDEGLTQTYTGGSGANCPCRVFGVGGLCIPLGDTLKRRTTVRYVCNATLAQDAVTETDVVSACVYQVTVSTPRVCCADPM